MKDWTIAVSVCLLTAQTASAQSNAGSLFGTVVGPDGAPVVNVPIRAVNAATSTRRANVQLDERTLRAAEAGWGKIRRFGGDAVLRIRIVSK